MGNVQAWVILGSINLLLILAFAIQPLLSAKNILFGVSIPRQHATDRELRKYVRHYMLLTGVLGLAITVGAILLSDGGEAGAYGSDSIIIIASPLIMIIGMGLFLYYHGKVLRIKRNQGWEALERPARVAADLSFRNKNIVYSWYWFLPHVVAVVVSAVIVAVLYDRVPEVIPMQYGFDGEVTRTAVKNIGSVFMLNFIQLFLIGIFLLANYAIRSTKQNVNAEQPQESVERERSYRRGMSLLLIGFSFLLILFFTFIQFGTLFGIGGSVLSGGSAGFVIVPAVLLVAIAIRLFRARGDAPKVGSDSHWKGGILYWNPQDSALFVEKRVGVGWTINAARPLVWVMAAVFIGVVVLIVSLATSVG